MREVRAKLWGVSGVWGGSVTDTFRKRLYNIGIYIYISDLIWSENASKIVEIHEKSIIPTAQEFCLWSKGLNRWAIMSFINMVQLINKINKNQNASKVAEIHKKFTILTAQKGPRILLMKNVNFSDFWRILGPY